MKIHNNNKEILSSSMCPDILLLYINPLSPMPTTLVSFLFFPNS